LSGLTANGLDLPLLRSQAFLLLAMKAGPSIAQQSSGHKIDHTIDNTVRGREIVKIPKLVKILLRKQVVLVEGIEPTRPCGHRILSPARLPVPPHQLQLYSHSNIENLSVK
jgi:hypothetical protein